MIKCLIYSTSLIVSTLAVLNDIVN